MNNPDERQKELARVRSARLRFSSKEAKLSAESSLGDLERFIDQLAISFFYAICNVFTLRIALKVSHIKVNLGFVISLRRKINILARTSK